MQLDKAFNVNDSYNNYRQIIHYSEMEYITSSSTPDLGGGDSPFKNLTFLRFGLEF